MSSFAGLIIALAGAWAVMKPHIHDLSPWVWETELQEVSDGLNDVAEELYELAGDVYREKASDRFGEILDTEDRIDKAADDGKPRRVKELRQLKRRLEQEKLEYEKKHKDFRKRQK